MPSRQPRSNARARSNIHLSDGARLTFTGSGKVTSDVETDAFCYVHAGELLIRGGDFKADGDWFTVSAE